MQKLSTYAIVMISSSIVEYLDSELDFRDWLNGFHPLGPAHLAAPSVSWKDPH